ncbi:MAG: hypothetical protein KME48_07480 [Candidatus Thiodiazotropha sp. (ex Ctena orbiculata)]|uniref:PEP-CTERM sorting domain-containing protein n=1 Tax=Candidatus Thiodiazotropha taylori TaxID=2792791 RepID=A0A944QSZ3_9GAMM|nr:hypothetical protein [Candidatus Thiodiazotropha taylori]MBT3026990.1 hypothetical protein [Candidatus Thiodiazotropha taylori]MBT3034624.1 hypothetical protein [Candidatus Thiodiazotropha taylori]MBV2137461.1 hypothetical protein [Candidatus Thiodiazotropha taylori]
MNKKCHSELFAASVLFVGLISTAEAATIIQNSGQFDLAIAAYDPIGQSFIAEDLRLGSIAFAFSDMNPTLANLPVTMTLYEGAGFGGNVVNSVAQTLPAVLPGTYDTPQFIDFNFSGTDLTIGDTYTATVTTGSSYKVGVVYNGLSDAYLGGQLFHSSASPLSSCPSGCDLNFRVTPSPVPVPGAALLFSSALIGLWRFGKKKS